MRTYKEFSLFSGLGGTSLGFQRARGSWRGTDARYECIGGVDVDREACDDHERLTGVRPMCADVSQMTVDDMREAAGGQRPDVVVTSPPCKGFSALLSNALAQEPRYQALNRLVFQGVWLCLEAWVDRPPRLFVLENVPMIRSRGAKLLHQLRDLLARYGYRTHEGLHDCGELGGLAQHRKRYLLVARHEAQVPSYVYRPPQRRVRAIGEVLSTLPMPNDPAGGPLHVMPRLELRTWARLALIPAGQDWRALGVRREGAFNNVMRVVPYDEPSGAVTSGGTPTASGTCVADPNVPPGTSWHRGIYKVIPWDEASGAVTGRAHASTDGPGVVSDPRVAREGGGRGKYRITGYDEPAGTVIGASTTGQGAFAVADPAFDSVSRPKRYGVADWDRPIGTVSGRTQVTGSNATGSVSDPRWRVAIRNGQYGIADWHRPAGTVVGAADVHQGTAATADPRVPRNAPVADERGFHDRWRPDPYIVILSDDGTWHRPLTTLELAALQALPVTLADGSPLTLAGGSVQRWRERIGNAVPVDAAEAIGEALLEALVMSDMGENIWLDPRDVWVRDPAAALACAAA